ncbi:MAG TPA: hypothetical protein VHL51_13080 [Gaiellales bacterium]|nr:hypothetical protein [Gaiellales bacterium]
MPPDDFFDGEWEEPSRTQETAPTRPVGDQSDPGDRPPRPGRSRSRQRRPASSRPSIPRPAGMPASLEGLEWGRLGMLAAGVLVLVLVLLLLTKACGGSSASSKNEKFFTQVSAVLKKSDSAGQQLHDLLHSPQPVKPAQAVAKLGAIEAVSNSALQEAQALKPTKEVESLQPYLLQTLAYRNTGLKCLKDGLLQAIKSKPASQGGAQLTLCTRLLLASDAIYTNSYAAPASKALQDHNIDLQVPTSTFLAGGDVSMVTPAGMTAVLQHLKPGAATHGLHGLKLDTVVAKDSSGKLTTLQVGTVNKVKTSGLTFLVSASNGGNYTEFNVPVKITIGSGDTKVQKTATIPQIARGATETVSISGFDSGPQLPYGPAVKMHVLVTPVPGERTASNNAATYEISFSL